MQIEKDFFEGKVSITDDTADEKKTKVSKLKEKGILKLDFRRDRMHIL